MASERAAVDFAELYTRLDAVERALSGDERDAAERARILDERARAVAQAHQQQQVDELEVLAFKVGGERFGVEVRQADQVVELEGLTALPAVAPHVLGVISARAQVLTVLDLRPLLGLQGGGMSDLTAVVAVRVGGERFGIAVEEVEGKLGLARAQLSRPVEGPFSAVSTDRVAVLDLARLIALRTEEGEPGS